MPTDPDQPLSVFRHEAGTPLAVIGGALRQLEGADLAPDDRALVDTALRQCQTLQRLLDQLRFADRDDLTLEREEVDVGVLAEEVVADLRATVLASHSCVVEVTEGPTSVLGDPVALRQMLFNLLDNAAKYSPEDTEIHLSVERDGDTVVVAVTDEGTGVSEGDAVRIFERYERATTDGEGLGLGLYVVWRVVEAHDGEVRAEPAPAGSGAQFVVRLPALAT